MTEIQKATADVTTKKPVGLTVDQIRLRQKEYNDLNKKLLGIDYNQNVSEDKVAQKLLELCLN